VNRNRFPVKAIAGLFVALLSMIAASLLAQRNDLGPATQGDHASVQTIYGKVPDERWRFDQTQGRNSVTGVIVKDAHEGATRLVIVDGDPCKKQLFYFKDPDTRPTGEQVSCGSDRLPEYRVLAK
jgi:hypothetical protein